MPKKYDFIIVGAGNAGRTAAETLAAEKAGSILLTDAEPWLPYKRTQISKNVAKGYSPNDFAIHPQSWYAENGIDFHSDAPALSLNAEQHVISTSRGDFSYGSLFLALGARPAVPFTPPRPWSTLWTVNDGLALRQALSGSPRVAIVGMGVLGVEAAWQMVCMGLKPILIGRSNRPLAQYLDEASASALTESMRQAGVSLFLNRNIPAVSKMGGTLRIESDQELIEADHVVMTTGSAPSIALPAAAGLDVSSGICVDPSLRTSIKGIWAGGDAAQHPDGTVTGLWHAAEHQGHLAAQSMLGKQVSNSNPPYRMKCEAFGGLWFSSGPVNAAAEPGGLEEAESWRMGDVLWRPRFQSGRLAALAGSAPAGLDKSTMQRAQKIVLDGAARDDARKSLEGCS